MEEEQRRRSHASQDKRAQVNRLVSVTLQGPGGGGLRGSSQPLFANSFTCSHLFRCVST